MTEMELNKIDWNAVVLNETGINLMATPSPTPRERVTTNPPADNINFYQDTKDGMILLDPSDPFEAAVADLVNMNRKKRRDYAVDGDPFSNFKLTSDLVNIPGFGPVESAYFNLCQKVARLSSLRANGRMDETANESVTDTYLDLAVYAIIVYTLVMEGK